MFEKDIFIAIASHKKSELGKIDGYYSVLAGAAAGSGHDKRDFDFFDDEGDNISSLNKFFCELTVNYWVWKNVESPYVGLVHYRRFFSNSSPSVNVEDEILKREDILEIMQDYDMILPVKKSFFPFKMRKYYDLRHEIQDIIHVENIILEKNDAKYIHAMEEVWDSYKLHLYNMFICKKPLFNYYMEWVMPILWSLEEKKAHLNRTTYQSRAMGFIAERLFNVWVKANENEMKIKYLPVKGIGVEKESKKALNAMLQILGIKEKR